MIRQELTDYLPTTCLENFCLEAGLNMPDFLLLGAEGVVHAPIFCYKVSVGDIGSVSTGQSKKKAKHAAAHNALIKLLKVAKEELKTLPSYTLEEYKESDEFLNNMLIAGYLYLKRIEDQIKSYEIPNLCDQNQINSVGKLQEVCMKNKWTPPTYETIDDELNDNVHEKIFTMICEIKILNGEILTERGQGRSKKEAKRLSALKMLKALELKDLFTFNEEADNLNKRLKKLDDGYTKEFVPAKKKIDQFYSALEYDLNKELDKLLDCLNENEINFIEKLNELACYIECKLDFIDYLPLDNELLTYTSMVNLTPYYNCPIILTGWGQSSKSTKASRNEAARTAILLFNKIRYGE